MAGNETLSARNRTPADEFYTQLTAISPYGALTVGAVATAINFGQCANDVRG